MKVLIVEDDKSIQESLVRNLRDWGMQTFSAFNFEQAKKLYREHSDFDVIVVDNDLGIASESGRVFIRKIRDSFLGKIIAASGSLSGCSDLMKAGANLSCEGNKEKVPEIIKQILATSKK